MATFGRTALGGTSAQFPSANSISVSRFTLTDRASVTKLTAHSSGALTVNVRGVIYSVHETSGLPRTLIASTAALASVPAGWYDLTFGSALTLDPGIYFLGVHADASITSTGGAAATGINYFATQTYASGAPSAFPTASSSTIEKPIHATYSAIDIGEIRTTKALGYAVVSPPNDQVSVTKAIGYAVITDQPAVTTTRRRPVIAICG